MSVPVIGLVENMTAFACPHCGELTEIFGRGGGERFAAEHGLEYLGGVPLDITVRQGGDVGVPAVAQREPGPAARALVQVAQIVAARMSVRAADRRRPTPADHLLTRGGPGRALRVLRVRRSAVGARYCADCGPPADDGGASSRPAGQAAVRADPSAAAVRPARGDRRIVTALFADLVDYVRMLAEYDPEEVRDPGDRGPGHDGRGHQPARRDPREVHRRRGLRGLRLAPGPRRRRGPGGRRRPGHPVRACTDIGDGTGPLEVRIGLATGEVVAAGRGPEPGRRPGADRRGHHHRGAHPVAGPAGRDPARRRDPAGRPGPAVDRAERRGRPARPGPGRGAPRAARRDRAGASGRPSVRSWPAR